MYGPFAGFERNPGYRYLSLPKPVRLDGPWTSLVSFLGRHFYHWLYDELPKLWILPEIPSDTRILIPANPPQYILDTIDWLGLSDRVRVTGERHLIVDEFYFSAPSAMLGCPNPFAIDWLRKHFLSEAKPFPGGEKIYLVRKDKTRGLANATELETYFEAKGWTLVDPESLSLERQIQCFAGASAIAGLHGGAFTNLIWCQTGAGVVELFADNFVNGCYEGIAAHLSLEYKGLIFESDGAQRAKVDIGRLSEALLELGL